MNEELHFCQKAKIFPEDKFLQLGKGKGRKLLIVGESPAMNGWVKSGKAFYTTGGRLLPSGRNLNKLLVFLGLTIDRCGFTELVKCCVGENRKLLGKCAPKWKEVFKKQIALCRPRLMIILGVETLRIFNLMFCTSLLIGDIGEVNFGEKLVRILPIYHPSPRAPKNHSRNEAIFDRQKKTLEAITHYNNNHNA